MQYDGFLNGPDPAGSRHGTRRADPVPATPVYAPIALGGIVVATPTRPTA